MRANKGTSGFEPRKGFERGDRQIPAKPDCSTNLQHGAVEAAPIVDDQHGVLLARFGQIGPESLGKQRRHLVKVAAVRPWA